ncbi:MAG: alanine--tRNA ligase [Bifidobacteriaceae bacterium]|jgi:alanyl-tRNA synthetase|nr:alanine--tRNA ligase [Bifidobacteriaceae bacterium]
MQTSEIRRRWLEFFEKNRHTVVPSASLISPDPSTLFTIAGMVPFIPYMTGLQTPPFKRATSVQKCVRTLDIDEVGKTTRHVTFFQMNGNFSFGDYFKAEAIQFAWDLVTGAKEQGSYGFPKDKIWVTIHDDDDEAFDFWRNIAGLEAERIQRRGNKDNFWSTGAAGPGGPCSEIYVDRGPDYGQDGGPIVDEDRFLEIWNLVFMQYAIDDVKSKEDFHIVGPLKSKNIDTGMGLERTAALLQNKDNVYEIDEIYPVIAKATELTGKTYGQVHNDDVQFRILADHVRSAIMIISDGVKPSNEGRGYVLRRLLRRSVRAMKLLGYDHPSFNELFAASKECMGRSYPEVITDYERISQVAFTEEDKFLKTLTSGISYFDLALKKNAESGSKVISGADAFRLHDTHGFPIELTLEMANEKGLSVDETAFRSLMQEQKDRARQDALKKRGADIDLSAYDEVKKQLTEEPIFQGYDRYSDYVEVVALINQKGPQVSIQAPATFEFVTNQTPFYPQGGGQLPDEGTLRLDNGSTITITDVQKPIAGLIVHRAQISDGSITVGDRGYAEIDVGRREAIARAHSATHMVHKALQEELGSGSTQAGSEDAPDRLRFDIHTPKAISDESIYRVEQRVNDLLKENLEVTDEQMSLTRAREIGAMALFGEKYGDIVRVVRIGGDWSKELCIGTHVKMSGQLGTVSIISEESIGSGVRRIDALVSTNALKYQNRERVILNQLNGLLKTPPDQLYPKIESLLDKVKVMEKRLEQLDHQQLFDRTPELLQAQIKVGGYTLVAQDLGPVSNSNLLRELANQLLRKLPAEHSIVVLFAQSETSVVAVIASNLPANSETDALQIAKIIGPIIGGGGGGKPNLAQAGGTKADQIPAAVTAVREKLQRG